MVRGVEVAPFIGGGGFFTVEAFEADVDVRQGGGESLEDGTNGFVGVCFRLGVGAVPFAHVGEGEGEVAEVGVVAHDVPGASEDEGADGGEHGEFRGCGLLRAGFAEVLDHGGFFAVAAFDCEDAGFGEEAFYAVEYLAYGCVV